MKKCNRCKLVKDFDEFAKNKKLRDGLQNRCKACQKEYNIKYYNPEKQKNKYLENKDKIALKNKLGYQKYKEERKAKVKFYRDNNRSKINAYHNNRRQSDNNYRILLNLRSRLSDAVKGESKSSSTKELLGCSIEYLRLYLEDMFDDDMSWYNYGLWHIDHIRPCASFNLSDPDQQKQCFHYTNLQPLWAKDNLSKGAKYES